MQYVSIRSFKTRALAILMAFFMVLSVITINYMTSRADDEVTLEVGQTLDLTPDEAKQSDGKNDYHWKVDQDGYVSFSDIHGYTTTVTALQSTDDSVTVTCEYKANGKGKPRTVKTIKIKVAEKTVTPDPETNPDDDPANDPSTDPSTKPELKQIPFATDKASVETANRSTLSGGVITTKFYYGIEHNYSAADFIQKADQYDQVLNTLVKEGTLTGTVVDEDGTAVSGDAAKIYNAGTYYYQVSYVGNEGATYANDSRIYKVDVDKSEVSFNNGVSANDKEIDKEADEIAFKADVRVAYGVKVNVKGSFKVTSDSTEIVNGEKVRTLRVSFVPADPDDKNFKETPYNKDIVLRAPAVDLTGKINIVANNLYYTGMPVVHKENDIKVTVGNTELKYGVDYDVDYGKIATGTENDHTKSNQNHKGYIIFKGDYAILNDRVLTERTFSFKINDLRAKLVFVEGGLSCDGDKKVLISGEAINQVPITGDTEVRPYVLDTDTKKFVGVDSYISLTKESNEYILRAKPNHNVYLWADVCILNAKHTLPENIDDAKKVSYTTVGKTKIYLDTAKETMISSDSMLKEYVEGVIYRWDTTINQDVLVTPEEARDTYLKAQRTDVPEADYPGYSIEYFGIFKGKNQQASNSGYRVVAHMVEKATVFGEVYLLDYGKPRSTKLGSDVSGNTYVKLGKAGVYTDPAPVARYFNNDVEQYVKINDMRQWNDTKKSVDVDQAMRDYFKDKYPSIPASEYGNYKIEYYRMVKPGSTWHIDGQIVRKDTKLDPAYAKVGSISKRYTGKEVTLSKNDFTNKISWVDPTTKAVTKFEYGKDFDIVVGTYENNTNVTTDESKASVTIHLINYDVDVRVPFDIVATEAQVYVKNVSDTAFTPNPLGRPLGTVYLNDGILGKTKIEDETEIKKYVINMISDANIDKLLSLEIVDGKWCLFVHYKETFTEDLSLWIINDPAKKPVDPAGEVKPDNRDGIYVLYGKAKANVKTIHEMRPVDDLTKYVDMSTFKNNKGQASNLESVKKQWLVAAGVPEENYDLYTLNPYRIIRVDKKDWHADCEVIQTSYRVKFVNENTTYKTEIKKVGEGFEDDEITDPTKASDDEHTYKFKYWSTTVNGQEVKLSELPTDKNSTVYAVYDSCYEVTFRNDDDSIIEKVSQLDTQQVTAIDDPTSSNTDTDYDITFDGWYVEDENGNLSEADFSTIRTNTTVYAKYTSVLKKYTLTFHNGEETDAVELEKKSYIADDQIPQYTKDSEDYAYELTGWTNQDGSEQVVDPKTLQDDADLYPIFKETEKTFTITFMNEGEMFDTVVSGKTKRVSASDVKTPTKAEDNDNTYTFDQWVDANGNEVDFANIKDDVTVTASYKATAKTKPATSEPTPGQNNPPAGQNNPPAGQNNPPAGQNNPPAGQNNPPAGGDNNPVVPAPPATVTPAPQANVTPAPAPASPAPAAQTTTPAVNQNNDGNTTTIQGNATPLAGNPDQKVDEKDNKKSEVKDDKKSDTKDDKKDEKETVKIGGSETPKAGKPMDDPFNWIPIMLTVIFFAYNTVRAYYRKKESDDNE